MMKDFYEKLQELLEKAQNNDIEPIEWAQVNEESGDETIITTRFQYIAPKPNKHQ